MVILPMIYLSMPNQAYARNDNLLALDLSYSLTSLLNHGWGVGLNYERNIFDFFSFKGNFGHMTFLTSINNVYCTSVHISLFANYYPLGGGLDKSYIGIGNGCDFMNYFGNGELPDNNQDILIHITPQTGWKFKVMEYLMIDVSIGYKFIISDTQNYRKIKDYVNDGLRFGLNFHIFLPYITAVR